jgi:hypothetical protein
MLLDIVSRIQKRTHLYCPKHFQYPKEIPHKLIWISHVHRNTKICHFIINPTTVDFKNLILKPLHQQTYKGFCAGEVGLHIVCKEIQCQELNRGGVCPYKNNAQNKWSSMLGSVHASSLSLPTLPSTIALNIEGSSCMFCYTMHLSVGVNSIFLGCFFLWERSGIKEDLDLLGYNQELDMYQVMVEILQNCAG